MKLKIGLQWVTDLKANCGGIGEKSVRNLVDDALSIANKLENGQNDLILNYSTNIKSLLNTLCVIIKENQVFILKFFIKNSNIIVFYFIKF
jgi:hypothetical protein